MSHVSAVKAITEPKTIRYASEPSAIGEKLAAVTRAGSPKRAEAARSMAPPASSGVPAAYSPDAGRRSPPK